MHSRKFLQHSGEYEHHISTPSTFHNFKGIFHNRAVTWPPGVYGRLTLAAILQTKKQKKCRQSSKERGEILASVLNDSP